jgi:hypothetical protein
MEVTPMYISKHGNGLLLFTIFLGGVPKVVIRFEYESYLLRRKLPTLMSLQSL